MTGYLAMTIADGVSVAVHRRTRTEHPSVFVTDTVLSYSGDGTARLGAEVPADSTRLVGFFGRVGEPEDSGQEFRAEDLVATATYCLVHSVTAEHGGAVPHAVLTHPNTWSSHALDSVRDALDRVDLDAVTLISDEVAAQEFFRVNSGDLDQVTVTRGALAIVEAMYPVPADSADTDALPIVTPAPALAFSEAIPVQVPPTSDGSQFDGAQPTKAPNSKRPIVIVTAAAVALVVASIGIAAAMGAFSDGADVVPPAITDAGPAPTTEPSPAPVPAAAVPIPTVDAAPSELPSPESVPTTGPPIVETIPAQPLPPPAPETVPPETVEPSLPLPPTRTLPPRLTFPNFTFPDLSLPGR